MGKRSSVVIGLGGSGSYVVRYLRNKYAEKGIINDGHPGPKNVHYLCIDSWKDESDKSIFRKEADLKTTGLCPEFLEVGIDSENYNKYLNDNGSQFPQISRWLPKNSLATIASPQHGAGQWRALGRLIFYHNLTKAGGIQQTINNLIDYVKQKQDELRGEGTSIDNGIDFYLVYSVAGGTGAGMFMDLAILIKKLIQEKGMETALNQINHYAFMPNVFKDKVGDKFLPRIMANGYGSLVDFELMHKAERTKSGLNFPQRSNVQNQPLYVWNYNFGTPKTWSMQNTDRPWTGVNLISKRHNQSDTDVKAVVAETLYLIFDDSEFGEALKGVQSNRLTGSDNAYESSVITNNKTIIFKRELQTIYSTFGLSFIRFDRASLVQKAANMLGRFFVDNYILRKSALSETKKNEILGESFLRYEDLTVALKEGSGQFSVPQLIGILDQGGNMASYLEGFSKYEEMSAKEFEENYEKAKQKLNNGELEIRLKNTALRLIPDWKKQMQESLSDWINKYGLMAASELCRELKSKLEKSVDQMRKILDQLREFVKASNPLFDRLYDAESLAFGSFRKDAMEIVRGQLKRECNSDIQDILNSKYVECIIGVYNQLIKILGSKEARQSLDGSCEEFTVWARELSEKFGKESEVLSRQAKGDETYCVSIQRTIKDEEIKTELWNLVNRSAIDRDEINFSYNNLSKLYSDLGEDIFTVYDTDFAKSGLDRMNLGKLVSILIPTQENSRLPFDKNNVVENLKKTITNHLDCSNTSQTIQQRGKILEDFGKNIKITEILEKDFDTPKRDNYYTQLVNKASLLFERTTNANIVNQNQARFAKPSNYLGIHKGDLRFSDRIETDISAKHSDGILQSRDANEDNIFIYKDLTSLPACFYNELGSLKEGYESHDNFAKRDLVHFDFAYFKNEMLDLCYVDPDLATFIEENASKIILAIVLKIIAYDKANDTLRFIFQGSRILLGMDLYNVINYLHGQPEILANIHELLNQQIRLIKERGDKMKAIQLVNSLRLFRMRINETIQGNPNDSPLFKLVAETLIPMAEKLVSYAEITTPPIKAQVDELWAKYLGNVSDESAIKQNIDNYKFAVDSWYETCSPTLPIPVIK